MPVPKSNEHEKDFIPRCIGELISEGKNSSQAAAICHSKWDEHTKMASQGGTSFDYDGVLSTDKGKELAAKTKGNIYIISARRLKNDILNVAEKLGINSSNVYATGSNKAKVEKIKELGINTHWDNNPDVIKELGSKGKLFK
jgi:hypothetical protein